MENKVNTVIQDICPVGDNIAPHSKLQEDLGIDSLRLVELIIALEEEFSVEFELSDLNVKNFVFVSDLYRLVDKYKGN